MLKKLTLLVVLSLFLSASLFAQDKVLKPVVMDEPSAQTVVKSKDMGSPVTAADYVAVAVMPNAYGPAAPLINPLAYDPKSDVISVVYRHNADGAGSGQLFWSYSTDGGATYTQSTTSVQSEFISAFLGRYPSMTLHNPENSSNLAQLWGAFAWPDLATGGTFDDLGYGVTLGMESSGFASLYQDPPAFSSRTPIWSDGEYVYWTADNQDDDNLYLFKTKDYASLEVIAPWSNGGAPIGGAAVDGKIYAGFIAPFEAEIGAGGWEIGYSVSEDQGATWSAEVVPDWRTLDATANYTGIWDFDSSDGNVISFAGDIQVDGNGYVHFVVGLEDSSKFGGAGHPYAIVELFETADGWDSKVIAGDLDMVNAWNVFNSGTQATPAIGQMGYSPFIATNQDRDVYVAQWIYMTDADTTADVYMAIRAEGGEWSDPINLTETPEMNETGAHLAPMIKDNGDGSYVAYSGYYYETGNTGPYTNDLNEHTFYIAAVPLVLTSVESKDEVAYNFDLAQNYPNPFNPSTTIKYSVPELADVSIKIYDMLGKEVTTLVDAQQAQGVYEVTFDASNLASGMYIYTMKAGSYQSSKKMLLMK
jgi:hypothetical protein